MTGNIVRRCYVTTKSGLTIRQDKGGTACKTSFHEGRFYF